MRMTLHCLPKMSLTHLPRRNIVELSCLNDVNFMLPVAAEWERINTVNMSAIWKLLVTRKTLCVASKHKCHSS